MALTKIFKPRADYHTWTTAELAVNDIIDVYTSLGGYAKYITIESDGGGTMVRFNVGRKIYGNHESVGNAPYMGPDAAFWPSPLQIDEVEEDRDNIIIPVGSIHMWRDEIAVRDIKIIQLAPVTRIIVSHISAS